MLGEIIVPVNMIFYIFAAVCLAFAAGATVKDYSDEPELEWPNEFQVDITKMSLTGSLVENVKIWHTRRKSRVDYNNGAVKSIVLTRPKRLYRYGVKYEIHPETTEEELNKMVCHELRGRKHKRQKPENILPLEEKYERVGSENINDIDATKFYKKDVSDTTITEETLWAEYYNEEWAPVRYEVKTFNTWIGSLEKHEIWDFTNFNNEVDDEVFSVEDYNCDDEYTKKHTMQSESVTKDLLFINPDNEDHVNHVFNAFKERHNKNYADKREHAMRKNIFRRTMRLIASRNRQNLKYKLAINQFADRTPEEMTKYKGLRRRPEGRVGTIPFPYDEVKLAQVDVPSEYDLRLYGLVSRVKSQGTCGSCWTFGVTAAVEGALARANGGKLMSLSNQAILDCAWGYGGFGCDGGTDVAAYDWIMKYGLPTEAEYGSYTNQDGYCNIDKMNTTFPIKGFTDVTPNSVGALKVAVVNHGPLSVSVHLSDAFASYAQGVFYDTECNSKHLDHEVALVGYGERDGDTFWILKNSWGPKWGLGGYMFISAMNNNCGVMTEPTYPVI